MNPVSVTEAGRPADPALAGATLRIDLAAMTDNWRKLRDLCAPGGCAATVKADAYGCGLEPAVKALAAAGCTSFFVALPLEGRAVRAAVPDADVFILNGLFDGQSDFYLEHRLIPCLASLDEARAWAAASDGEAPSAVHVDTGINRLGLSREEAQTLAADTDLLRRCRVELVMSHFACADNEAADMNDAQRAAFSGIAARFPGAKTSLANSPGVFLEADHTFDLARPGVAIYGGNPFSDRANPMRPVVHLSAPVLQVRDVCAGDSVGYAATWRAERASRIAVIAVGYADGLPRHMSWPATDGPAQVFVAGHMAPIVGRVSMDMITVDVTDVPAGLAVRGAEVELLGEHISVDDWARWSGTIPYEILTSLGRRYAKLYSS